MSAARDDRQYADLIEQRRSIEHAIAVQNGTLEPTSDKVKREVRAFALVSFFTLLIHSFKG
jgi:hypothetical protein